MLQILIGIILFIVGLAILLLLGGALFLKSLFSRGVKRATKRTPPNRPHTSSTRRPTDSHKVFGDTEGEYVDFEEIEEEEKP